MAAGVRKTRVETSRLKPNKHSDFSEEYSGRVVKLLLHNGTTIEGILVEARRYWIKLKTSTSVIYVNKAWVVYIE